jgi:hypothetical protein
MLSRNADFLPMIVMALSALSCAQQPQTSATPPVGDHSTLALSGHSAAPNATPYVQWLGIWLPPSVEDFHAVGAGWQNWTVDAQFAISPAQLSEFVSRNRLRQLLEDLSSRIPTLCSLPAATAPVRYLLIDFEDYAATTATGFTPTIWVSSTATKYRFVSLRLTRR